MVDNMGLFPLAVERYLNRAVAIHAPGVTTVTNAARYYALHGLVASEAVTRGLSNSEAQHLLRRCEVVLGMATIAHQDADDHDRRWSPDAHGGDYLRRVVRTGPVELTAAAGDDGSSYARAKWGFWGPYRGSEMTLQVLSTDSLTPGPAYRDAETRAVLGPILEIAASATALARSDFVGLEHLCLCQTNLGQDAAWLSHRFAGDIVAGGVAGVLGQTMRIIASAITTTAINSEDDVADFIRYDHRLLTHPRLVGHDATRRWRGITLRHQSVRAWRYLWEQICGHIEAKGAIFLDELRHWFMDAAPDASVDSFVASLPATSNTNGQPLPAESHATNVSQDIVIQCLSVLALGARRLRELDGLELLGFQGEPHAAAAVEELSPHWMAASLNSWADRPMTEFYGHLLDVLLNRSQRVAMRKSTFDTKTGRFVFPARIHIRDGIAFSVFPERARPPVLRIERLMFMGEQVGLFARDNDGRWQLGDRGELVA